MDEDVDGSSECLGDLIRGIGCGDVELQRLAADPVHHLGQRLTGLRHVHADDIGAVAGEVLRDRGSDSAGGAGDHGGASGQRAGVAGGHEFVQAQSLPGVRGHREELAGDIGGFAGEQEPQGRSHRGCGEVDAVEEDSVGGGAGAHLVGDRPSEAGDALSSGGLLGCLVLRIGCRRNGDHSAAGGQ